MGSEGQYKRILLPVDGSQSARDATRTGLELARLFGAEVTVVSVIDITSFSNASQGFVLPDMYSYMDQATEALVAQVVKEGEAMGVRVRSIVTRGSPSREILELSKDHDLIVMGTQGRSGASHAILGSVAERVVRFAHSPVMVVKSRPPEDV